MQRDTTASRLKQVMEEKKLKQVDILNLSLPLCEKYNVKMNKSDISQYVSGKVEPSQEKLVILGMALNVTESWLMGFDVPKDRQQQNLGNFHLSNKERILISDFRELNPQGQDYILQTMDLVKDKYKKCDSVSELQNIG